MLVRLPQTLTVSETYELGRYGSLLLTNGRLPLPTNVAPPGSGAAGQALANALNRIVLDDGSNQQNPRYVRYPAPGLSAGNPLRAGYTVSGVQGVLERRYNAWRLQPVPGAAEPAFDAAANPRAGAPARHAQADVRVASFNVLNYFNGDGKGAGFDDPANRGAKTPAEFERQEAKIVAAINALGIPAYQGSCSEVYLEKAFDGTGLRPAERLPVARELGETSLMFLTHPTLTPEDVDRTCTAIRQVFSEASA